MKDLNIKHKVVHTKDYPSIEECFQHVTTLQEEYTFIHVLFNKLEYEEYFPEHLYGYYDDAGSWVEVDEESWDDVEEEIEHRVLHPAEETKKWDLTRIVIFCHGDMTKQQYIKYKQGVIEGDFYE